MNNFHLYLTVFSMSFLLTLALTMLLIPLMSKKAGQKILEIGPSWHKSKEGTPTMGGISFIIATIFSFILYMIFTHKGTQANEISCVFNVIIYSLLNGCIGFVDDLSKVVKKENKGLSAKMKFLLQSISGVIFLALMKITVGIDTEINIPFFDIEINLGIFYYLFAFLLLCGFVNAVNLTDGIDGLATSVTITVAALFSVLAFVSIQKSSLVFLSATLLGSMIAFLIFNAHPAKIFMGDTGSLFLGAIVVGFSFIADNIMLVLIYGGVYLIEALSVIFQVIYFKATKGKRLLKMAPLHHHFEKCGWSETKIVVSFVIFSTFLCLFTLFELLI